MFQSLRWKPSHCFLFKLWLVAHDRRRLSMPSWWSISAMWRSSWTTMASWLGMPWHSSWWALPLGISWRMQLNVGAVQSSSVGSRRNRRAHEGHYLCGWRGSRTAWNSPIPRAQKRRWRRKWRRVFQRNTWRINKVRETRSSSSWTTCFPLKVTLWTRTIFQMEKEEKNHRWRWMSPSRTCPHYHLLWPTQTSVGAHQLVDMELLLEAVATGEVALIVRP